MDKVRSLQNYIHCFILYLNSQVPYLAVPSHMADTGQSVAPTISVNSFVNAGPQAAVPPLFQGQPPPPPAAAAAPRIIQYQFVGRIQLSVIMNALRYLL